jgi:hypothetical protein
MTETQTTCGRCKSQFCSEISDGKVTIWICMSCGSTSNTTITDKNVVEMEANLPELYKALKFKDEDGRYWYPNSVVLENKAMVFAEGESEDNWKWSAVQSKDGKADMTTKKEFDEKQFSEALNYIGYFKQITE